MKLISYKYNNNRYIGHLHSDNTITNLSDLVNTNKMITFIEKKYHLDQKIANIISSSKKSKINLKDITLLSPIPVPKSLRDAYSFRQHVETSRKNRGLKMIPEFDDFPVYYYSNHNAIYGPGEVKINKKLMKKLDFELEIAIVIGEKGENIKAENADNYIAGFMIMNDISSRLIQLKEMKLNLGPAKGKDFATVLGPYIATSEEFTDKIKKTNFGNHYDLNMKCEINGKLISQDNLKNMYWTFAQIIEQISKGTTIYPGDVIGSGTCATGCFLELNQTNSEKWLKNNDIITITVDKLGTLQTKIREN